MSLNNENSFISESFKTISPSSKILILTPALVVTLIWSNNVRTAAHACYYNYGFELDDAGFFSMSVK